MSKLKEYTLIFFVGAFGYSLIEIFWRGYTHWSMSLTGGICLMLIYLMNKKYSNMRLPVKCIIGALIITSVEFLVGCIVNLVFKLNVWDYSGLFLNLFGQISLLFTVLWFLLCIPVIALCSSLEKNIKLMAF